MTFALGNLRGTPAYAELAATCRSYSVMFSPTPNLQEGGSGIFVRYKSICGILSATHVMAEHIDARLIFSPLLRTPEMDPTLFLNMGILINKLIYLETAEGIKALQGKEWAAGALDICLIQLDPLLFNCLLQISGKQAVDLLEHKTKYSANTEKYCAPDHNHGWCWAVDGAPREDANLNDRGILESRFDGLYVCAGSMEGNTYKTDQLTLVRSPFDCQADRGRHDLGPTADALPDEFSGISGGGMWQVRFRGTDSTPESINEMLLSGICTAEVEGSHLSSRGPSALYDIFTVYLDTLL